MSRFDATAKRLLRSASNEDLLVLLAAVRLLLLRRGATLN